ncbi:MAG TPA: hypothetical protein VGK20_00930 [Candidatus Binatia bacterium]|jgi:hypothetical protein
MSRRSLRTFAVAGALAAGLAGTLAPAAWAEPGGCSQPVSTGADPVATDCLFILRAAVGSATCSRPCICEPRGVATKATDALLCLQFSVGQNVPIDCPCNSPGKPDLEASDTTFDPSSDVVPDTNVTGHSYNSSTATNADPYGINDNDIKSRFVKTRFIGAIPQDPAASVGDWTEGWTVELHGNHTVWHPATNGTLNGATPVADGNCPANTTLIGSTSLPNGYPGTMDICQLPGRFAVSGGTLTLTNDNIYRLGGLANGGTLIGDGDAAGKTETNANPAHPTAATHTDLVIEPGTLVLGDVQEALIVTRGSTIHAVGTKDNVITLQSKKWFDNWLTNTDYTGFGVGSGARREWGGLVLTGFGWANACNTVDTCDALVEGIAVPVHYGGTDESWNGGHVEYMEINDPGYDIDGNGNDLNCFTLYTLGSPTIVSHIDCNNGGDDQYEFFGGNVVVDHVVATGGLDDNLDTDVGFRGGAQFAVLRQAGPASNDGDKGFEADNGPQGDPIANVREPRSHPHYANVTWLGQHTTASQHGVSIGFRTGTGISVWNTTMQNSRRAELESQAITADSGGAGTDTQGSCQYAGPPGLNVEHLHNLWIWQPTPNEAAVAGGSAEAGYFNSTGGDAAHKPADIACVASLFESDPTNQKMDPMVDTTSGMPNQVP